MLLHASVELPEPSYLDRLARLESSLGRGPHAKDQWGRDPDDREDSDNGLSDDTMERLWEQDQVEMRKRLEATKPKSARKRASEAGKRKAREKEKATTTRKKEQSDGGNGAQVLAEPRKKRRTDPAPLEPSSSVGEAPGPRIRAENEVVKERMQVEEPPAPLAGHSGADSRRTSQPFDDRDPPPHPDRTSLVPPPTSSERVVVEVSSDSDPEELPHKPKRAPPTSNFVSSASTSKLATLAVRGAKGKNKARQSMEQAIIEAQKIKPDELKTRFADISAFVDHLSSFELDRPGKLLEGCRILFVNADHWKVNSGTGGGTRNRLDQGLRLELGIVARQGGTIVKPQDFVPSPRATSLVGVDERELECRAEAEQWTTHIIGYHPTTFRPPTFDEVLGCLGDDGVSAAEELGPFVKVVKFSWVSETVKARKRRSEWEFAIPGDPREAPSSRVSSNKSSPTKKSYVVSAEAKRQGRKRRGPEDGGDTTGESQGEDDDGYAQGSVSPFGPQDYPAGERPVTPEQIRRDEAVENGDNHSDDGVGHSPPSTTHNPLEGLEEQSKLVKELGDERVDGLLHEGYMIYRGTEDDDETENEADEEQARREGREVAKPSLREKNPDRKGYVVNRKFAPPGSSNGPNDAIADVLMQLADFHKGDGDEWRTRGYRMAAGQLRSLAHKVTDYNELIKIRGIGSQIAEKIVEIHKTGTHRKLQNELPESRAARLFSNVYGIGPALGLTLAKRGAKTIEDLRKKDIFDTLTPEQQIGLKYYDDLLQRIPRDEVTELYKIVLAAAREVDPKLQVDCMGSYRRKAPNSGDIDILVTRDPTEDGKTHSGAIGKMYKILRANQFFQHILSQSDDWSDLSCKVNGLCKLPGGKIRRIDILGVPWEDMPAALIYFTGNDHFNRSLRLKARHMGYSLNQKCLSRSIIRGKGGEKLTEGERINVKSERDIFRILKVPYKLPEERIPS